MLRRARPQARETPELREVWIDAYAAPPEKVNIVVDTFAFVADAPAARVLRGRCAVSSQQQLLGSVGHTDGTSTRLSAFWLRGSQRTLLYTDHTPHTDEWLGFDSVTLNPSAEANVQTTGGVSGPVALRAGDSIEWECENTPGPAGPHNPMDPSACVLRGWYAPSDGHWVCEP